MKIHPLHNYRINRLHVAGSSGIRARWYLVFALLCLATTGGAFRAVAQEPPSGATPAPLPTPRRATPYGWPPSLSIAPSKPSLAPARPAPPRIIISPTAREQAEVEADRKRLAEAIDRLKNPPDYAAESYYDALTLERQADKCRGRGELAPARKLLDEAAAALRLIHALQPEWMPEKLLAKIKALEETASSLPETVEPVNPLRRFLRSDPFPLFDPERGQMPDGAREYQFEGQKYYFLPL